MNVRRFGKDDCDVISICNNAWFLRGSPQCVDT